MVGNRGSQLSAGQKQRPALAKVLIRNPAILLLDEATSALDSQSESLIQNMPERAKKGRATITIANRLSTIVKADKIYVLDRGMITETSTHAELMALKGHYSTLPRSWRASRSDDINLVVRIDSTTPYRMV